VIVHCYNSRAHQRIIQERSEVFQVEHRGDGPPSVTLLPWVLFDDGRFEDAFALCDRIFREGLEEVRKAEKALTWTRSEIQERYSVTGDLLLAQIGYILQKANVAFDSAEGWRVSIQLSHLVFPQPSLEDVFVKRPTDYRGGDRSSVLVSPYGFHDVSGRSGKRLTSWVFVGSTWADLGEKFRPRVLKALLSQRMLPLGMEHWSSDTRPSLDVSLQSLAQANLALFVLGERYGSPARDGDPRSFTETEYDTAVANGTDVIAFVSDDETPWPNDVLDPKNARRQKAFRAKVLSPRHVRRFRDPAELEAAVISALVDWERGPGPDVAVRSGLLVPTKI
jgi:hypothetical protein